jgi:trimeric autotransporter adhesin
LKDGKLYDENTGLVAPWMRQPDEFSSSDYNSNMDGMRAYSNNSNAHHHSSAASSQYMHGSTNYHHSNGAMSGNGGKVYNPSAAAASVHPSSQFDMMGGGANPSKYSSSRHDPPAVATYSSQSSRYQTNHNQSSGLAPNRVTSLDVLYSLDDPGSGGGNSHQPVGQPINREASEMTLNSFIGWPSMTSLLNSDEPSNLTEKPRTMMSALSSAVLNELQNLASNNSLHPSSNIDMENPSSARSTNKRSHDASQDTPTKRQVLISSSTAINQQQGSGGSSDVMIKRERNEPAYEDVGYSLEDDQAWSLPTNHHQSRSMSDTSSATSTVHSSSTAAAHSNNNKPKSTTSSSHKSTIKAMTNQHEPIMPATHTPAIELIGAAVSSSFYQPIVNATSTAPVGTTSTATIANNVASLAAAASTVASSTTTTSLPPASSKSKSEGNGNSQANSSRGKAIPHNSSVENFW